MLEEKWGGVGFGIDLSYVDYFIYFNFFLEIEAGKGGRAGTERKMGY